MRKNWKRVTALAMATTMVAGASACSKGGAEQQTTTAANNQQQTTAEQQTTTEAPVSQSSVLIDPATGKAYDLGGMRVVLADWWYNPESDDKIVTEYDEARAEYLKDLQETYNFTFERECFASWSDMPGEFVNYASTGGGDKAYIFTLYQGSALANAMAQGLMWDLNQFDCLDFSDSKWCHSIDDVVNFGTKKYGMRGIDHEATSGIYFNKRLLEEAGIDPESIYELQRTNKWTWAEFEKLLEATSMDTDADGVIDKYAMTNFTSTLYPAAVLSNGGSFIGKDANGQFVNNLETDATLEALNWAVDLVGKYEMVYPADAAWDYTFSAFANGEAAFTCADSYRAGQWSAMEDDFGFVCFPMGPRMSTYTNPATDNVYVIPTCYDEDTAWKLAFVYNLYTDAVPGYEDYVAWKSGYYNSFRDTESVDETMVTLVATGVPQLHNCVSGIDMGPDLIWGMGNWEGGTPAEKAEAIREKWQALLDTANGK